jgi:DNA-binding LytR/AlgR family response regulator
MILRLEQREAQRDVEIAITYPVMDKTLEYIVSFLKSAGTQVECYTEDSIKMVNVPDIYYIESTGKTAVVYCEKKSYRTRFRLFQLNEKLTDRGFVQINKHCILNINKLDKIRQLFNSRMEMTLANGIHLYAARTYLADIKRKLQENT